ncbi:hypothetical protein PPL_07918 [Heterostelium album PN500]|uniref:Uncharacterized protein n=1 Tax=Heterostelium pallidum (strain ATCC 26659 / Pp 5 / PN500) TaxID=670386 RepID=D3BHB6_HETP5|nr:hypothetical protein PPL_07918 [Heterostelium album PN500]EFA79093.1 hypothetical protein PPL_07918 [Heterostelium album PN500]|eukprot:XP_020431215.1 hypothetical protein PPL_07918 [Heterostelium album PN500]
MSHPMMNMRYNQMGKMEIDDQIYEDFDEDSLSLDPMNDNNKQIVHQDFFNGNYC